MKRVLRLIVPAAAVAILLLLSRAVPTERRVALRLGDPSSITQVQVTWLEDTEPVQGSSWSFDPGSAPHVISSTPKLKTGEYTLAFSIHRGNGTTADERRVMVADADEISLSIP